MKRKSMVVFSVIAVVWLLGAISMVQAAGFDWTKFAGDTLTVFVTSPPQRDELTKVMGQFEKLTGMKVRWEDMDATSYRSTLPIRLVAKSGEFDVTASMTIVDGEKYKSAGWYEPLDKFILNDNITHSDWDFNDFPAGVQEGVMRVGGEVVMIPWELQTQLLYYRRDLFQQRGIAPPDTFEDLEVAAEKLTDRSKQFYGIALRGSGYQTTTPFSAFLYGMGGSWLDEEGNPTVNTPEAIEAIVLYGRLGNKYGPPGIAAFDWKVPGQQMAQGRVAMFLDINISKAMLEDPEKSRVAGKIGYTMVPRGSAGRFPFVAGWGWTINPFSPKKEQAWYFIQWVTSRIMMEDMQLLGYPMPRESSWQSWKFAVEDETPDFTQTCLDSYEIGMPWMNPPIKAALEAREIIGAVVTHALEGISREQIIKEANEANKELGELIKRTQ